jgi:hypothetical protein
MGTVFMVHHAQLGYFAETDHIVAMLAAARPTIESLDNARNDRPTASNIPIDGDSRITLQLLRLLLSLLLDKGNAALMLQAGVVELLATLLSDMLVIAPRAAQDMQLDSQTERSRHIATNCLNILIKLLELAPAVDKNKRIIRPPPKARKELSEQRCVGECLNSLIVHS